MNGEGLLIGLVGSEIRESACGFSLAENSADVLAAVTVVREGLIRGVERRLRSEPAPSIAALIRALK
jgi:hypothetical protein